MLLSRQIVAGAQNVLVTCIRLPLTAYAARMPQAADQPVIQSVDPQSQTVHSAGC
jgi:hypothetical protein